MPNEDFPVGPQVLPLVQADAEDVRAAMFGSEGPSPETPLGAATLFRVALRDVSRNENELRRMSVDPARLDFPDLARELQGWSIYEGVIESTTRPQDLAYVKLLPLTDGEFAEVFEDAFADDVKVLTMVKNGGTWGVWGLTHNDAPLASDVFG